MTLLTKPLYSLLVKHRFKIIVIAILFAVGTATVIFDLDVDADFISLLNPDNQAVKNYNYLVNNFSGTDIFVLLVKNSHVAANPNLQKFMARLKNTDSVVSLSVFDTQFLPNSKIDDKPATVLLVKPSFKPTELKNARNLSKEISSAAKESGLDVGISGSYQVLVDSADSVNKDMYKAAVITFLGIFVLLLIILKLPVVVVIATAAALILSLCSTLALTKLILGKLNFLTATLPAVILGLGVDFSLHIVYSFSERAKQLIMSPDIKNNTTLNEELIAYAHAKTFKPLFVAAFTTAAAFLALCFAKSKGLFDMGLVGAIGIASAFLVAVILLPVLLSYVPVKAIAKIRRTEGMWVRIVSFFEDKSLWLAMVVVITVIISAFYSSKVGFSTNQDELVDSHIKSMVLQNELLERYHLSPVPIMFISPDRETENKKLEFLKKQDNKIFGFIQNSSTAEIFNQNPEDFKGKDGSFLALAYPTENPFELPVFEKIERLAEEIRRRFPRPGNIVTGSVFLNFGLNNSVKADLIRCTIIAFIFVFAAVYAGFRAIGKTILSMLPVTLGTFLTVGLMGLLQINFNIMTVVVLPLIIGTGIDDGVHIQYSWYREKKNIIRAVSGIASAVVATTLTSMIAFGSLISARNPGFRELGLVASAGLGFCLIISLVVLPCVLDRLEKIKGIRQDSN